MVAAASEEDRVVTNGMSEFARDRENINGALLVGVTPEDFGGDASPLAGVSFQRKLEADAFALGGGGYLAPAQRVGDFLAGLPSSGPGQVRPTTAPAWPGRISAAACPPLRQMPWRRPCPSWARNSGATTIPMPSSPL